MYQSSAAAYKEMEVRSASPGQLVVIVYDHLLVSLRRARIAMEAGNIELRSTTLAKCRAAVEELLGGLDFAQGGGIAKNLGSLYAFLLTELVDLGMRPDPKRLDRLTGIVAELRDAFAQAAAQASAQASATGAARAAVAR